jgi:hypothetical protein
LLITSSATPWEVRIHLRITGKFLFILITNFSAAGVLG